MLSVLSVLSVMRLADLVGYRLTPTVTGSLTSVIPKVSCTPATTSRASVRRSSVVASPRLVRARVCLVEMRAGPVP